MRTVFSNDMVAHVWAQQNQDYGRNSNESFYFQGATIYSYGSHFPIARFQRMPNGERVVLMNSGSYSNTTAKHQSHARVAIPGDVRIVYCENPEILSRVNGEQWDDTIFPQGKCADEWRNKVQQAHSWVAKAKRARKYGAEYLRNAESCARSANEWRDMMGMPVAEFPDCEIGDSDDPAIAEIERKARADEARRKTVAILAHCRNEIVERERDKLRVAYLREWRAGNEQSQPLKEQMRAQGLYGYGAHGMFPRAVFGNAYCRVNGDKVETSMRADVPVSHAKRIFPRLMEARENGKQVAPIRVGHFQIDSIDENGLHAGCHEIAWSEIEYVARELELVD